MTFGYHRVEALHGNVDEGVGDGHAGIVDYHVNSTQLLDAHS